MRAVYREVGRAAAAARFAVRLLTPLSRQFAMSANIKAAKAARMEAAKREEKGLAQGSGSSGAGKAQANKKKAPPAAPLGSFTTDSKRHTARVARGELLDVVNNPTGHNIHDAVALLRETAWAKFDETVEVAVNLNLDPRKPNQSIKGVARLPHGVGKVVRVAVFAGGESATAAKEAGADVVGGEDLVARIQGGDLPFDTIIATPEMMSMVSKIGKILGPRGLMPNPKLGTVTKEVARAVKTAKAGAVQFRVEKKGIVQAGIGKLSFSDQSLLENIRAMMIAIADAKPEAFKGVYFQRFTLSSTMGAGIPVDISSVDPNNAKFLKSVDELKS